MSSKLSIITPTYNRAYTLENVYKSLLNQTSMEFEWIVVDDGSTDGTADLIQRWKKKGVPFDFKSLYQSNGGKHRALNKGIEIASGDFIFILDSDDEITFDAVETIYAWIETIKEEAFIAGVSGMKMHKDGTVIGGVPKCLRKELYVDVKNSERKKYGLLGDKAEIYRASLLKKYRFPEFEGEKFLSEDCVWNELAYQGYKIRWYAKPIYICEYLDDGLSKKGVLRELENFEGLSYSVKQRIKTHSFFEKIIISGYYYNIARIKGISVKNAAQKVSCPFGVFCIGAALRMAKRFVFNK